MARQAIIELKQLRPLIDVDPEFSGKPPADFQLAEDSPAGKIGFRPIPFEKIGVYASDDRATWPARRSPPRDRSPP
jgi:hypothetical protein